ncbi:cyclic nucleotide-binding domain-containing protein [Thermodesulfobacteriota bacterium]
MKDRIALSGSLKFVTLPDIFQILGGNNSTGVLKLTTQYSPQTGIIYISQGNPINAEHGSLKGLKALYNLFGWTEGEYLFYEDNVGSIGDAIKKSRMEIVLDALRMLDDGKIKKIGPLDSASAAVPDSNSDDDRTILKGPLTDYLYVVREDFFKDGECIVEEGMHGKWIWSVYEGTVKVTKNTQNGPLTIARLGEGCFIGTLRALLYGEYERNATVTAEGDVRLCLLDAEPFYREYSKLSIDFRHLLLSIDQRLRKLNERAADLCLSEGKEHDRSFSSGSMNQNLNMEKDLYRILEGNAQLVTKDSKDKKYLLSLEENDVMGHIPFIDFGHEPKAASIIPSGDMKTEMIDIQKVREEYDALSRTFKNLIFNIGSYISSTTSLVQNFNSRN